MGGVNYIKAYRSSTHYEIKGKCSLKAFKFIIFIVSLGLLIINSFGFHCVRLLPQLPILSLEGREKEDS